MHCKFLVFLLIVFLFSSFFSSACEFRLIERIGAHGKQNPDIIIAAAAAAAAAAVAAMTTMIKLISLSHHSMWANWLLLSLIAAYFYCCDINIYMNQYDFLLIQ